MNVVNYATVRICLFLLFTSLFSFFFFAILQSSKTNPIVFASSFNTSAFLFFFLPLFYCVVSIVNLKLMKIKFSCVRG